VSPRVNVKVKLNALSLDVVIDEVWQAMTLIGRSSVARPQFPHQNNFLNFDKLPSLAIATFLAVTCALFYELGHECIIDNNGYSRVCSEH
jgi:hypothetical protein